MGRPPTPRILLHCFLFGSLMDSCSLTPAAPVRSVVSEVGNQVTLPCCWKEHLPDVAPPASHVLWATPAKTVFELWGGRVWQAEEFQGRAEVPQETLLSGNCSLVIGDVQIGDAGSYESFLVLDGARSRKTRVFIQSVRLSVLDRKSTQSRAPGDDFVLDLYTSHALRVVFQARNCSAWTDLWMRGDGDGQRLQKDPLTEQLRMKRVARSDEGRYRVVDQHGLAVNTVQLSVERSGEALRAQQVLGYPGPAASSGETSKRRCWALLVGSLLLAGFRVLLPPQ
ncbi:galectin 17 isoform X2 [Brachionichthys hirsutus]|uniref:galectin 17 isoform X2 n=1 Tax=Brachionichthys hirsutus TaxID=412623 RepID=UPI003605404C